MGRILVIEDEPTARLMLQSRLEDLGHEVATAPTGAMGLMEARAARFDLFVVDVVLGAGVDGYEVTRRLKAMPQTHGVPVVLLSGQNTSREDLHRGYEAGCEAFLIKGDMTLLEDVVRAMIRIKSLQDDLGMQNRLLEEQNRRLQEEKQRGADLELALRESGARALVFRALAAGRPDGMLVVDAEGLVQYADRGAREILGSDLETRQLGRIAPASGLEAFVRDARTEPREGFRFDLGGRGGRPVRSLSASVIPVVSQTGTAEAPNLKVVILLDAGKRRVAGEMLRMQEQGVPRREMGPLLDAAREVYHPGSILGEDERIALVRRTVAEYAKTDRAVLIEGERGVGKGRIARTLHYGGTRSGAFVPVDCAALAPEVLEVELFGHVKGAFTGALSDRAGAFQQAHMGTIFLSSVEALPLPLQEGLLAALTTGTVQRIGAARPEQVDVRVIAATSAHLEAAARAGTFRPELLERLRMVAVAVPPLRDRAADIPLLVEHYLHLFGADQRSVELGGEALWVLESYDWPGNVGELETTIERACAMTRDGTIGVEDLPGALRELSRDLARASELPTHPRAVLARPGTRAGDLAGPGPGRVHATARPAPAGRNDHAPPAEEPEPIVEVSFDAYEKLAIERALEETGGDRLAAARLLKVGKSTLYRKLKRHGIT